MHESVLATHCLTYIHAALQVIQYVTRSDKIGLIAGKYMCSLKNVYLHFCESYKNSVSFNDLDTSSF